MCEEPFKNKQGADILMEDGLKLGKRHDTPNIQIDYQKETLTGFDSSATYTINGETVTTAEDNTITI